MMGETGKPPESNGGGGDDNPGRHPPHHPLPSSSSAIQNGGPNAQHAANKKFTAYKLIVDPAITKGAFKVYRFDGVIPGDPTYPSVLVRDPRKQRSAIYQKRTEPMVLPVPLFKIDANYVGGIPPTEVTITNLNDNIGNHFLYNLVNKYGLVSDAQIYYHPISHRHLEFGHTVFKSSRDAKACVEKLNGTLVMGKTVNVFFDPAHKKCQELFIEVTTQKPGAAKDDGKKSGSTSSAAATKHSSKSSTSRQNNADSHNHHGKDDSTKSTPHLDSSSVVSASSDDRKSSSKSSTKSRDSGIGSDGFKRFNHSYERFEAGPAAVSINSNYGYPIHGSARGNPSSSVSSQSNCHLPSSPAIPGGGNNANSGKSDSAYTNNNNYAHNSEVYDDGDLSPKIDLDTRIKMMLEGRNSGGFGKLFSDVDVTASTEGESDVEPSPLKRARLSLGSASAQIWDSESDEELSKEASFARKFKQSFVPVNDGSGSKSKSDKRRGKSMHSPPPSPFLELSSGKRGKTKNRHDPELDQISDDEDANIKREKDDMSLSSLSPDTADSTSRIRQAPNFGVQSFHPGQGQPPYYSEYYNTYTQNYNVPPSWGSQPHQQHPAYQQYHDTPQPYPAQYPPYGYPNHDYGHGQDGYYINHAPPPPPPPPPADGSISPSKRERGPPEEKDHENATLLIESVIECVVEDLRKVLRRDCNRRLIEAEAFKMYETWFKAEEEEFKRKQEEETKRNARARTPLPPDVLSERQENMLRHNSQLPNERKATGMSFKSFPKLPSFRKKLGEGSGRIKQKDEDSRKSFFDSDSEEGSSSENEAAPKRRVTKPLFHLSSSSESDDDASSVSSKSTVSDRDEPHDLSDAEAISTTEDEEEFGDIKTGRAVEESEDYAKDVPRTPGRIEMETEDILSDDDDDSPEEAGAVPEEEIEGSLGICDRTGRMIIKHIKSESSPEKHDIPSGAGLVVPTTPTPIDSLGLDMDAGGGFEMQEKTIQLEDQIKKEAREVFDPLLEEKRRKYRELMKDFTQQDKKLGDSKNFLNHFHEKEDEPLMIPDELMRPRSSSSRYDKKKNKKGKGSRFTPKAFRPRMEDDISLLLYEFFRQGIDAEDMVYFKQAYDLLLCDDSFSWLNATHWVNHPQTLTKPPTPQKTTKKRRKQSSAATDEEEGSMRTRGFQRMTKEEKIRAMKGQATVLMSFELTGGSIQNEKQTAAGVVKARDTQIREARSNQRRLLTALGTESDLLKFNQLQFRKKALRFARSGNHEWGLFAAEPIAADEMVIEYVGQMIRPVVADLRKTKYEAQGIGSSYLFRIDLETIIDATRCGNLSRFINHSCNPNCYAKVITIEGKKKIVIYSKQPIGVSEEITYDYKFPIEDKKIPCLCGTPQCRGTLN